MISEHFASAVPSKTFAVVWTWIRSSFKISIFLQVISIPKTSEFPMVHKSEKNLGGGGNLPRNSGARNFPIFITPKKFTSFYSKDFLPKLIFLRKGVHHPKFRFSGVRAKFPDFPGSTDLSEIGFRTFCTIWYFLPSSNFCNYRLNFWKY